MTVTSLRSQENVEDSRWETAVRCIKKYEGWHGLEHHPYVAYGHRIRKGEKFPARLTESEGDCILRFCFYNKTDLFDLNLSEKITFWE